MQALIACIAEPDGSIAAHKRNLKFASYYITQVDTMQVSEKLYILGHVSRAPN